MHIGQNRTSISIRMDPRKRKRLEQLLSMYKKRNNGTEAVNILNIDHLCSYYVCEHHSELFKEIISLDIKAKDLKNVIDNYDLADSYGPQYHSISSYHGIVKELPLQIALNSPKTHMKISAGRRYSNIDLKNTKALIKHMDRKVDFILQNNLLKYYIKQVIRDCEQKTWKISNHDIGLATVQIKKFVRVCQFMPPNFKISTLTDYQLYLFFAKLLNLCCERNIRVTDIVTYLSTILFQMYPANIEDFINVQQPMYSFKFFDYILQNARHDGFNIQFCLSEYPKTIWEFAKKFSVLEAAVSGNKQRVLDLMNHGFDVFPEHERRTSCHVFSNIPKVIPFEHQMILEVMKKIKLQSSDVPNADIIISARQKECFQIIWNAVPAFYVTKEELFDSIYLECGHLFQNGYYRLCSIRLRRNLNLAKMYATNFKEIALSSSKPENIFRHFFYVHYKPEGHSKIHGTFRL